MSNKIVWTPAKYYNTITGETKTIDGVEVSNTGKFRYSLSKRAINISNKKHKNYLTITVADGKGQKSYLVHKILASSFLSVPNQPGRVVDHIDGDRKNNSLNNLRFVSVSENNYNKTSYKVNRVGLIVNVVTNSIVEIVNVSSNTRKLLHKPLTKYLIDRCEQLNNQQNRPIIVTKLLYDQISAGTLNLSDILAEVEWRLVSVRSTYQVSPLGILRKPVFTLSKDQSKLFHYTSGSKSNCGTLRITIPGENKTLVHDVVAKIFLNNGKDFSYPSVVDHIDTDQTNNKISNLRIVTHKENMNNPITKSHKSKSICCTLSDSSEITFDSLTSCANHFKVSKSLVTRWISRGWFSKNTTVINFKITYGTKNND